MSPTCCEDPYPVVTAAGVYECEHCRAQWSIVRRPAVEAGRYEWDRRHGR